MDDRHTTTTVVLYAMLCVVLAACGPSPSPTPVQKPATPTALPTPPPEQRSLTVCQGQEPSTLYIHGASILAAVHIQSAIYDGPIDRRSFDYQPVILERSPSLYYGDATFKNVTVKPGDVVVDDEGEVIELFYDPAWDPIYVRKIRPSGCFSSDCAVHYNGGEVQMDRMVVTFTLIPGITWADGTPVTAYDSEYSYHLFVDPATPSPARRSVSQRTASYTAVDERTIVWTGLPGFRDRTYFTNFWTPLPKHQLDRMTSAEIVSSQEASQTPMGYGPFTVREWVKGDHITLLRNPYYHRSNEGLPRVDQVVFRFFDDDDAALAALLTGECDILTQDLRLERVADLLVSLEAKGQVRPVFVSGTVFEHLDFGLEPADSYDRPDFFGDLRMRRAIGMCLNRQEVIDKLFYGRSEVVATYVPPSHPLHDEQEVQPLPYDPAAAQALLDEMGWKDMDGDGIREAHGVGGIPEGTALSFKWGSTATQTRLAYMRIFQDDLKECGVEVILENMPPNVWFAAGPEGPVFGRQFDLGSFSWPTGHEPPCSLYLCSEIPRAENGWAGQNYIGYCNAEFDAACVAACHALPGTPAYDYYHILAERIFARDLPSIPLYMQIKIAATRPDITGFILDPTAASEMWNIEQFDRRP